MGAGSRAAGAVATASLAPASVRAGGAGLAVSSAACAGGITGCVRAVSTLPAAVLPTSLGGGDTGCIFAVGTLLSGALGARTGGVRKFVARSSPAPNRGGRDARRTSGRDSLTSSAGAGAPSPGCVRGAGVCEPLLSAAADGCRKNHSGSLPSLPASAGLAAPPGSEPGSGGVGPLLSGARSSEKSSSSAAPLTGPFSAPASLADNSPSSSPSVSAGAFGSGVAGAGIGAALRCSLEASPPSPDRVLRIDARISSRLLAPVASGLLIPHLTPMPQPASRSPRTRSDTT